MNYFIHLFKLLNIKVKMTIEEICCSNQLSKDSLQLLIDEKTINIKNNENLRYLLSLTLKPGTLRKNNEEILKYLLSKKTPLNSIIFYDYLYQTCELGKTNLVKILLDNDIIINCQNDEGETPLHIAIRTKNLNLIKLLMEYSPDLTLCTYDNSLNVYNYIERCDDNAIKSIIYNDYFSSYIDSTNSKLSMGIHNNYEKISKHSDNNKHKNCISNSKNINKNKLSKNNITDITILPSSKQTKKSQKKNSKEKNRLNENIKKVEKKISTSNTLQISNCIDKNNSYYSTSTQTHKSKNSKKNDDLKCFTKIKNNKQISTAERNKKLFINKRKMNESVYDKDLIQDNKLLANLSQYITENTNNLEALSLKYFQKTSDFTKSFKTINDISNKNKNMNKESSIFIAGYDCSEDKINDSKYSLSKKEEIDEVYCGFDKNKLNKMKEEKLLNFFNEINVPSNYTKNFIENGFDDLDLLISQTKNGTAITDKLLKQIGINIMGHRAKILVRLEELSGTLKINIDKNTIYPDKQSERMKDIFYKFLATINLEEFLNNFVSNGYFCVELMLCQMLTRQPITDEMLENELNIKKIGYRARLLNSLATESNNYVNRLFNKRNSNIKENGGDIIKHFQIDKINDPNTCETCFIF